MRRKLILALLVLFVIVNITAATAPVCASQKSPKVVLIVLDNTTWLDIINANDSVFNEIISLSAIGLQNNRPLTAPSRPKNALTVGSGVRADVAPSSQEGYNSDEIYEGEPARDAYRIRTGRTAGKNQVVELGLPAIIRDNDNGLQDFTPGDMADVIEQAGRSVVVLGNADTSLEYDRGTQNRVAVAIAINSRGTVRYGDVGKRTLIKDRNYPFGVKTDYDYLDAQFKKNIARADLAVIELGDTARADFYSPRVFESQAVRMKTRAIHDAGVFIKKLMNTAGADTTFIISSLSPPGASTDAVKGSEEQLTPIIINGPGFEPGAVVSNTTNRDRLVAITDLATTVLDVMGLQAGKDMQGSVIKSTAEAVTVEELNAFNQSAIAVKDTRRTAILAYIYIQIALYIFAAILLAFRKMINKTTVAIVETLIFTTMAYPLFSFYTTKLDRFVGQGLLITILTIAVSLVFATLLMLTRKNVLYPIIGISALTVGVLSIDILVGAPSIINSIFGYDPIRGARYFGIGNEAVSILVANTLLIFGIMLEKSWSRWALIAGGVLCFAVTVLIGFPGLGTNTDGPITAVAAFSAMMMQAMKSKNKVRNVVVTVSAMVAVLAAFGAYDVITGPTTHMGKSINLILDGGFREVFLIVNRKLAMNIMILRFSTWSYFLLITLGLVGFMWFKPVGLLQRALVNHKGISAAITASIVGGVVGFAFNDSGILIPAIIMSYMIPTVVYLMLWEQYRSTAQ